MPPEERSSGGHSLVPPMHYWIYGLRVESASPLPDWPLAEPATADVRIEQASLAIVPPEGKPYTAGTSVEAGEFRLAIRSVGRYAASRGVRVIVDPDPEAKPEDVRLYLTGAMMGTVLHQRGAYPLHASAVVLPGVPGAVGFAGRSGAGKSTMVTTLIQRGATFVSDDICVMAGAETGRLQVWPGAARVKLDENVLRTLPGAAPVLDPAGGNRGKFHLPVDAALHPAVAIPLSRVYLLSEAEGPPRLERLAQLDAVAALVDETYLLATAHALGLISQVFGLAARVAQSLPVIRLVRPHGLEHLPAVAALIEQDARQPDG
jgi:hypothetical protein